MTQVVEVATTSVSVTVQQANDVTVEHRAVESLVELAVRGPQGVTGPVGPEGPPGDAYAPGELRSATADVYTYLGRAELGTDEADETWTIARFSVVAGAVVTEHATGAWTDRETLSYE